MTWTKKYLGPMNTRAMQKLPGQAYAVWNAQKQRCSNPKSNSYKNYGAKGIRVEYAVHEFMAWYIHHFELLKLKKASVGRIDHSKNYSFDNIEMIEHADNAREMYHRTGGNKTVAKKPIVLVDEYGLATHVFSTVGAAAKFAGVTASLLCLRKRKPATHDTPTTKTRLKVYDLDKFLEMGAT